MSATFDPVRYLRSVLTLEGQLRNDSLSSDGTVRVDDVHKRHIGALSNGETDC